MLRFSQEKCNGCGLCIEDCKTFHSIELDERENKARKVLPGCNNCYHCVAICPQGAITIDDIEPLSQEKYTPTFTSDEYLEFLKNKRSIRQYKSKDVEKIKIERIIEAGRYTPTGGNRQPVHFAVITKKSMVELKEITLRTLKKLADEYNSGDRSLGLDENSAKVYINMWTRFYNNYFNHGIDELFFDAPCLLLVLGDTERVADPKTDCILAACNIGNMVYAEGLGFCHNGFFVRAFESKEVRDFLNIDSKFNLYASMTIGYADVKYSRSVPRTEKDIMWI